MSDVEKKLFFFFFFLFLASVEFFLGCLLTACFDSDDLAVMAFFSELTDGTGVNLRQSLSIRHVIKDYLRITAMARI